MKNEIFLLNPHIVVTITTKAIYKRKMICKTLLTPKEGPTPSEEWFRVGWGEEGRVGKGEGGGTGVHM